MNRCITERNRQRISCFGQTTFVFFFQWVWIGPILGDSTTLVHLSSLSASTPIAFTASAKVFKKFDNRSKAQRRLISHYVIQKFNPLFVRVLPTILSNPFFFSINVLLAFCHYSLYLLNHLGSELSNVITRVIQSGAYGVTGLTSVPRRKPLGVGLDF